MNVYVHAHPCVYASACVCARTCVRVCMRAFFVQHVCISVQVAQQRLLPRVIIYTVANSQGFVSIIQ